MTETGIRYLVLILKLAGMLVVMAAVLRLFYAYLVRGLKKENHFFNDRVQYVSSLLLAFEVLVAAGVLSTVLHPSWSDIGKLAAIAALRIFIKRSLTAAINNHNTKGV